MASQVDLCNAALVKLAQDIPIAAMSEQSKAARAFTRVWDRTRDLVLAEHPWPFSVRAIALALDAEAAYPGWAYRYAYPADCLQALAVCDEGGVREALSQSNRQAFEVVHGTQQTCIATDLALAYLVYSAQITDVSRFPPLVAETLACRLAMEVAPALAGEFGKRLALSLREDYEIARSKAIAHGFNESREVVQAPTPSLAARGGY